MICLRRMFERLRAGVTGPLRGIAARMRYHVYARVHQGTGLARKAYASWSMGHLESPRFRGGPFVWNQRLVHNETIITRRSFKETLSGLRHEADFTNVSALFDQNPPLTII